MFSPYPKNENKQELLFLFVGLSLPALSIGIVGETAANPAVELVAQGIVCAMENLVDAAGLADTADSETRQIVIGDGPERRLVFDAALARSADARPRTPSDMIAPTRMMV